MLPERFDLTYIDADGQAKRPVLIHRAIFGSFERFVGILTEHYAGVFPAWLSPVQAAILPITDSFNEYGKSIVDVLAKENIRAELDDRNEKVGYKIREWETKKVPYMLIVGQKEKDSGNVSIRKHHEGDKGAIAACRIYLDHKKRNSKQNLGERLSTHRNLGSTARSEYRAYA